MSGPDAATDSRSLVLQATDIVELIGQSVSLKKRGKDFIGLCPFHQEKTPSFHVSPSKQFFHCYGCKAGGNAIDFVIRRDRVEFIDALKTLAARANIELPRFGASKERAGERQILLEANSAAGAFFEKLLKHPELGRPAREYLATRGIDNTSVQRFQIGLAPAGWDGLLKSPVGRKFGASTLATAGLVKEKTSDRGDVVSHYDAFRNRLMFPIRDEAGRVIAFGGRVLPGSEDPAKYLNSPETPIFSKGRCVFGLDLARQRIVETRTVAVVEGYTDVVMAHQFGVSNVVSVLGTALTEPHVGILRRFADRIVLLFDSDTAGDAAVERAIGLFLTQPVQIAIASMPEGVDPDEYLIAHGAAAFEKVLNEAPEVLAFTTRQFKRRWDAYDGDAAQQGRAMQEFIDPFLKARADRAIDPMRWAAVIVALSKETGVPTEQLHRQYGATAKRRFVSPPNSVQEAPRQVAARGPRTAQDLAEMHLLGVLLVEPQRWHDVQSAVSPSAFVDADRRRLAERYWQVQQDEGEPVFNQFLGDLTDPVLSELAIELVEVVESLPEPAAALADALGYLREVQRLKDEQKLTAGLHRKDAQPGEQSEVDLLKRLQDSRRQPDLRRVV